MRPGFALADPVKLAARKDFDMASPASLSIDPFSREFLSNPYRFHQQLREAGPVVWLDALGIYAMARYEEVRDALHDWRTYCSGRGVGLADFSKEEPFRTPSLLLETDPPEHTTNRTIMNKVVSLAALRELAPRWQACAEELVDRLVARGSFDAVTDLAEVYPLLVFPDTIGLKAEGREHLLKYAAAVFNAFGPQNDIFHEGMRGLEPAIQWVKEACKRENLLPGGWGMAVHDTAAAIGKPSEECELLVRSLLSAGIDTTVNGIANMMYALSENPGEWEKLRARPELAKKAFEESLRWDSTVQTFFRTVSRDIVVKDVPIPEGSKVVLFLAAANRDPRKWTDAERYDIDRVTSGHVGFGFGIHQCLGQMVARQEGEIIAGAFARKVKSIRPAGPPKRRLNNTLHALESLPLIIEAA